MMSFLKRKQNKKLDSSLSPIRSLWLRSIPWDHLCHVPRYACLFVLLWLSLLANRDFSLLSINTNLYPLVVQAPSQHLFPEELQATSGNYLICRTLSREEILCLYPSKPLCQYSLTDILSPRNSDEAWCQLSCSRICVEREHGWS